RFAVRRRLKGTFTSFAREGLIIVGRPALQIEESGFSRLQNGCTLDRLVRLGAERSFSGLYNPHHGGGSRANIHHVRTANYLLRWRRLRGRLLQDSASH